MRQRRVETVLFDGNPRYGIWGVPRRVGQPRCSATLLDMEFLRTLNEGLAPSVPFEANNIYIFCFVDSSSR